MAALMLGGMAYPMHDAINSSTAEISKHWQQKGRIVKRNHIDGPGFGINSYAHLSKLREIE